MSSFHDLYHFEVCFLAGRRVLCCQGPGSLGGHSDSMFCQQGKPAISWAVSAAAAQIKGSDELLLLCIYWTTSTGLCPGLSARKDEELVQQRVIRMVGGCLSWEERLRKLCLFSWRSRDFRRNLQSVYTFRRLWERAWLFTVLHAGMAVGISWNNRSSERI